MATQRKFHTPAPIMPHIELFLDLDQTCIHSLEADGAALARLRSSQKPIEADGHFTVGWDDRRGGEMFRTFVRPGLIDFLQRLDPQMCRLHVWTAGTRDYAEEIVAKLFTERGIPIVQIFHREHCDWSERAHGHPKRLQTVRDWHKNPAFEMGPVTILLDDVPDMAIGQENAVIVVPAFDIETSVHDSFFRYPEGVWQTILQRARAQTAAAR